MQNEPTFLYSESMCGIAYFPQTKKCFVRFCSAWEESIYVVTFIVEFGFVLCIEYW